VGLTVLRSSFHRDRWDAIPGETRWVDFSHAADGGEDLVVYAHTFRRVRERHDKKYDVLMWKPATTAVAHRYGADEWDSVLSAEREWPPTSVELVPKRRNRPRFLGRDLIWDEYMARCLSPDPRLAAQGGLDDAGDGHGQVVVDHHHRRAVGVFEGVRVDAEPREPSGVA
jgi:hypothetical protein